MAARKRTPTAGSGRTTTARAGARKTGTRKAAAKKTTTARARTKTGAKKRPANLKTAQTSASPKKFIDSVPDESKRADSRKLLRLMQGVTGEKPKMWGPSIIGFGTYHYVYATGREGDWPLTGFSPRKQALTLYIMSGFDGEADLMKRLGKFKTGRACLYVKKLEDVDLDVLEELIRRSVEKKRSASS